ncbi:MAG TPA: DUF302 domain-containing protein [Terriglobales bacterium]|nr:DUF302 domain-containing protein [Terriglobales bacterium]
MPESNNGFVHTPSPRSVDETLQRLRSTLESKGIMIFATIDHSGEAAKVGMEMHPTKLLIFGNPRAGTPVMFSALIHSHRPSAQGSGLGRRTRQGLGHAKHRRILATAPRFPRGSGEKSRRCRHPDPESCGIIIRHFCRHA